MINKKYRRSAALVLAASLMLSQTSVLPVLAEEDIFVEEVTAQEEKMLQEENAASSASSAETGQTDDQQSGGDEGLIEDSSGNAVDSSLPAGLEISSQIASKAESENAPIVTVDASQYPAADTGKNAREVYWFCRLQLGLNHAAACGVLANVQLESGFRPLALGDGGTSYGICQWHLGRCTALMSYCSSIGLDYNTLEGQLAYLQYELEHGYASFYANLKQVPDTAEGAARAGWLMCIQFEMPDQADARGRQRGNLAMNNYYGMDFTSGALFSVPGGTSMFSEADEDSVVLVQLDESVAIRIVDIEGVWARVIPVGTGLLQQGYVKADSLQLKQIETASEEETETETETESLEGETDDAEYADEADAENADDLAMTQEETEEALEELTE